MVYKLSEIMEKTFDILNKYPIFLQKSKDMKYYVTIIRYSQELFTFRWDEIGLSINKINQELDEAYKHIVLSETIFLTLLAV